MKTVILCGGQGTRLSEETAVRPKALVKIGERPILWHIMNIYSSFGFKDFTLALGYLGEEIKDYFLNYRARNSDLSVDLSSGEVIYKKTNGSDWKVNLLDTGAATLTGGRLLRLADHLRPGGTFMLTYGDGVANVRISALLDFHRAHGKACTVTAVRPRARFGGMDLKNGKVARFREKPESGEGWINGGFFVMEPKIFDYIDGDNTALETSPMERLTRDGELMAYQHDEFWQCMDTLREKRLLNELWQKGEAPWNTWS